MRVASKPSWYPELWRRPSVFGVASAAWACAMLAVPVLHQPGWAAPTAGARPASGSAEPAASMATPLVYARRLHALRLALGGAEITPLPPAQLQQAHNDCALAIVRRLHHAIRRVPPSPQVLDTLFALGPRGVTLDRLAHGLNTLGWSTAVVRPSAAPTGVALAGTSPLQAPVIALVRPGHFVLVSRHTPTHVEFFDPLVGQVRQPRARFFAGWTGKGVQLSTRDN